MTLEEPERMQKEGGAASRFIKGTLAAEKGTMLVQPLGMLAHIDVEVGPQQLGDCLQDRHLHCADGGQKKQVLVLVIRKQERAVVHDDAIVAARPTRRTRQEKRPSEKNLNVKQTNEAKDSSERKASEDSPDDPEWDGKQCEVAHVGNYQSAHGGYVHHRDIGEGQNDRGVVEG